MESPHAKFGAHWDHKPPGRGTRPTQCRPRALTRRFMERIPRSHPRIEPLNLAGTARRAVRAACSGAIVPLAASRAGTLQRDVPLSRFGGREALRASHFSPGDVRSTPADRRENPRLRISLRPSSEGWTWRGEIRDTTQRVPTELRFMGRIPRTHSRTEPLNRSSRRKEALTSFHRVRMSLLTSAATQFMGRARVRAMHLFH